MIPKRSACILLLLSITTLPASGADNNLPTIPDATKNLYEKYHAQYTGSNDRWQADAKLVADLAAAPDADLCFLYDITRQPPSGPRTGVNLKELGKLNTQRTFDTLVAALKSKKWQDRSIAVWELPAFKRPQCVPLLLDLLENDPEVSVRISAADALKTYADPKSEPDLLKAAAGNSPRLTLAAISALAPLNSKAGLAIALGIMEKAEKQDLENAIAIVASYHRKTAFRALLAEFQKLADNDPAGWNTRLRHDIHVCLPDCIGIAIKDMAPFPDERLDEWQDFWARADPLLTDDLQLKTPPQPPQKSPDNQYAKTTDATSLTASLDQKTYRVGDPIRLDLALTNSGKSPVSTVLPHVPSGWCPTMGYGIQLKRGNTTVLDLAPSKMYRGSYSGPPPFQTLAPGETYRSSVCLQYWIDPLVSTPLPEGDYQLDITFNSSQFAAIKPAGIQLVHRWTAPPIKFTIKGDPLKISTEILAQIAEKKHLKFLIADLSSPQTARHEPAWRAIFEYGDSRLAPFVKKFEADNPDHSYYYLNAENLRPFEHQIQRPGNMDDLLNLP